MGQKVNPHGMRVGVIKDWDSRWFTSKQAFGDTLVEDYKIRKTLKKQLYAAGVPKIEIERTVDSQTGAPRVKVNVFCAKPGIVIGKGGAVIQKITAESGAKVDIAEDGTVSISAINGSDGEKAKKMIETIVKDPEVISTITYRELRELSYMGATVLHEDSIFPLRQEGIPIHVLNTNAPQDPGTMIVENTCSKPKFTITGIAGKKGFASITVEKSMMNTEIGFGRKVLGVFEDNNLSFEHMPSGIDTMTVFVHQNEFAEKEQQVIAGLHRAVQPDSIDLESDLALIAVVGRGMRRTRGTAGRIFSALAHAHVNVKMIDQGSSELNIIIGVENRDFETAIKAIYDIFVVAQI